MDKTVEGLQDDLKVLKNEIKETLADIRDNLLTYTENPFIVNLTQQRLQRKEETNGDSPAPKAAPDSPTSNGHGVLGSQPGPGNGSPNVGPPLQSPTYQTGLPGGVPQQTAWPGVDRILQGLSQPPADQGTEHPAGPDGWRAAQEESQLERERNGDAQQRPGSRVESMAKQLPESKVGKKARPPTGSRVDEPSEVDPDAPDGRDDVVDLLTIATLSSWIEDGISRVGHARLKAIIEIYTTMGDLTPSLKEVLLKLIDLEGNREEREPVPLRESLRVLAALDNLVWRNRFDSTGAALLSIYLKEIDGTSRGPAS